MTQHLFLYGTLMPGQARWPVLAGFTAGKPVPASIRGDLYDTGLGFPAMFPGHNEVPGTLVDLAATTTEQCIRVLDEVEGVQYGLFLRTVTECSGVQAWTYLGCSPRLRQRLITQWPPG
jgi:gamma-glutamylcyclotransferase (GGCT)/AIG2-like uncharacterized protein YtfP